MRCLALLALLPFAAHADGLCDFDGYTDGTHPWDVAIHAGPSLDSAVIGVAPRAAQGSDYEGFGADFSVVEMKDGWARIANLQDADGNHFKTEGWIDGAYVQFVPQTEVAFAVPDQTGPVVWSGSDPFSNALLDCHGEWALIRFDLVDTDGQVWLASGQQIGWVRGICASQTTTCDGLIGDRHPK